MQFPLHARNLGQIIQLIVASTLGLAVISKLLALGGESSNFEKRDLVLRFLTNQQLLWLAALVEIAVIFCILVSKSLKYKGAIIGLLGLVFVVYHASLWLQGNKPCSCFGALLLKTGLTRKDYDLLTVFMAAFMAIYGWSEYTICKLQEHTEDEQ